VTGVQMTRMRLVLAPVTQSGSSALCLGGGGNVGRAARMDHGDIQQGDNVGRGEGHFNVGPRPLTANSCNANGSVTGLRTRTTATRAERQLKDSFQWSCQREPRTASAQAIATHGVVNIAALDVPPKETSGGGDVRVGASRPKAKVATVDEIAVGEAEIRVHRDRVQLSPSVPALEAEQACAMRW
jgi:hypothetical protein